jgi:hypothetical protein
MVGPKVIASHARTMPIATLKMIFTVVPRQETSGVLAWPLALSHVAELLVAFDLGG